MPSSPVLTPEVGCPGPCIYSVNWRPPGWSGVDRIPVHCGGPGGRDCVLVTPISVLDGVMSLQIPGLAGGEGLLLSR